MKLFRFKFSLCILSEVRDPGRVCSLVLTLQQFPIDAISQLIIKVAQYHGIRDPAPQQQVLLHSIPVASEVYFPSVPSTQTKGKSDKDISQRLKSGA